MLLKNVTRTALATVLFMYISLLIVSCAGDEKPSGETSLPSARALRFEQDLLSQGPSDPFLLRTKYPEFFELFFFQVVRIGSPDSAVFARRVAEFASDADIVAIGKDVKEKYGDFSETDRKLETGFQHYKQLFPDRLVPQTLTFISAFNNAIICADSLLAMGLDMYLGGQSKYYKALQFPGYRTRKMSHEYIATDAMKSWLQTEWAEPETYADLLSHMVYQGKIQYALALCMPDEPDTTLFGYSEEQMDWCRENEKNTWSFFINNKLLFATEQNQVMKFVTDGPTTNGFPKESPGNIGQYVGHRIVEAYMKQHAGLPVDSLMNEEDYKKILLESKYKP